MFLGEKLLNYSNIVCEKANLFSFNYNASALKSLSWHWARPFAINKY